MTSTAGAPQRPAHFEPHIQGLRAIAVLLVVLYHVWPARLTGGYVGVDAFFVISGFLITGQLTRELAATGRVRLGSFWAKRARRLLPASLLVIVVSAILCLTLMPISSLPISVQQLMASTFYFENWALAASSTDYLNGSDESIAQHYWSLSLEEQFYVIWPLLLLLVAWIGVRALRGRSTDFAYVAGRPGDPAVARRRAITWTVAAVAIVGFVVCGVATTVMGPPAYFTTFTRMWEFAVGALVALVPVVRPNSRWMNALVGWIGVLAVLGAGWFYDNATTFPGWAAALPVVGTALAIAASRADSWLLPGRWLAIPPLRWFGDISYSLYLWHWPLIIVAPYIPGWPLEWWNRVILLLVSILLAWLTKRFVEDSARTWRPLVAARARWTAIAAIAGMAVSALVIGGVWVARDPQYRAEATQLASVQENPPECLGAASADCAPADVPEGAVPSWGFAGADRPDHAECLVTLTDSAARSCAFGSSEEGAPRVALVGDSHAYQYLDAMIDLAEEQGWSLTTYMKGACPWSAAPLAGSGPFVDSCHAYQAHLAEALAGADFDAVVVAAFSTTDFVGDAAEGYAAAWSAVDAPIVVLRDNPHWDEDPAKCLAAHSSAADCTTPIRRALVDPDPLAEAAGAAGADVVDLTEVYCPDEECLAVVGGVTVYRDKDHLTRTWVSTLAPRIESAVTAALAD